MPYTAQGNKIVSKKTGKVVGTSKTAELAQRAVRVRNAVYRSTEVKKRGPKRSV